MAQVSPPKPWERGGNTAARTAAASPAPMSTSTTAPSASVSNTITGSTSAAPVIPDRPSSLASIVNRTASNYTPGAVGTTATTSATNALNRPYSSTSSPYGYGGMSSYSSPYSRFGTGSMYGSSMYGGMGGMYGGGMYGGGMGMGMGGGMYGGMGAPGDPNASLTNNFAQSTQATFQMIESIVGAFGGFAQMLESTYMATHSSFFAMISVAEQFGSLRTTLGNLLGIYTLTRWIRTLLARLTGRPPPADATSLTPANFFAFSGAGNAGIPKDPNAPPKPSKKPFFVFLLAVFGLPYLMGKLIKALARSQEEALAREQQQLALANGQPVEIGPDGQPLPHQQNTNGAVGGGLDPSKLDFCRVLFDFPPPEAVANGSFNSDLDLQVKKGDLVAVLDKSDPTAEGGSGGKEGSWWRCRARDGRMGWLPGVYLETIQRRPQPQQAITSGSQVGGSSRANTMPASVSFAGSRAQTLKSSTVDGVKSSPASRTGTMTKGAADGKGGISAKDASSKGEGVESFQKAWVNER